MPVDIYLFFSVCAQGFAARPARCGGQESGKFRERSGKIAEKREIFSVLLQIRAASCIL